MVEAKMPARITPASRANITPCWREQGRNFYDNGFGIRSGQHLQRADFAHGITDHTDKDGNEQGDYDPDGCNAAGQFQFFFILDCHKTEQDMRHTEISKSPCGSGNNGQGTVRSGISGVYIIGKCHGEISRKLGGVVDNGTDTASSFYTKDQNYNTRATDMMILWIKSVVEAARNPPSVVYATITIALMIMAVRYFTPNKLEKSFPHAANPEAV